MSLEGRVAALEKLCQDLFSAMELRADEFQKFIDDDFVPLKAAFDELRPKVEGRNKSSSEKRDMTDQDARACLVGDFKTFNHKHAAAGLGLTYAQVYSCRLEYTFKHVHKELRDSGWKNPWDKKPG